jgi:hypothetical protein
MSKMKLLITSILASAFVFLGGAIAPISVFAEESAETHEISVESVVSEEVIEETESVENTAVLDSENKETESNKEKVEVTYEDILALMGSIAEKEGFKDEWDKTLYYIQTAASEKKVDTMIVLIVCVLVFLVIYSGVKVFRWYKKIKKDTTSKDIKDIKSASDDQTTAINGLIDEENKLVGKVDESTEREKALAKGIELQNVAIRCLIRGTNIKQDLKDEAFRALNESDDNCDKAKK